ncbi:hypothetical protein [Cupriavidus basilensis]|uniref:hypothetical protein n=1 Tax=Cupriavidus basilensis TaxID=68895 RepID=UPI0039F68C60
MRTFNVRRHAGLLAAIGCGATLLTVSGAAAAADASKAFFDAALCKPPYTTKSATALYEAAEKLAKPDLSRLGAAIYKLPQPIGQDGFQSDEVVFAGTSAGVLVQGLQAEALAARYQLKQEPSTLLGTATKGFARALPAAQQPLPDLGTVSIVARESAALPGKTLLICELVSHADARALKAYERSRAEQGAAAR